MSFDQCHSCSVNIAAFFRRVVVVIIAFSALSSKQMK